MGDINLEVARKKQEHMLFIRFNKLVERLKKSPEKVEYAETPLKNKDMLRLIELTGTKSKNDAIQLAIKDTIERLEEKNHQKKLEQLRYAKTDAHESSNEILDTDNSNRHYLGGLKLTNKGLVHQH